MFDEWKDQMNAYICRHMDRKAFAPVANELDADIIQLSELYTSFLLENGLIDENGCETELDFDEDDLMDEMLERFLTAHPCEGEREILYAALVDAYLTMVEEASEDM